MAKTTRETPASRRSALNTSFMLAGCAFIELAAWGMAWLSEWQTMPVVGAVAMSAAVTAIIVVWLRQKR